MKDEFDVVIMNDRMSRVKKEILTIVKNFIKK
jgi:guanylate kinase